MTEVKRGEIIDLLGHCLMDDISIENIEFTHIGDRDQLLQQYYEALGLKFPFDLKPSVETLYMIVNRHTCSIPY